MEAITETPLVLQYGRYKGLELNTKKVPLAYLQELEENLLMKGTNTSDKLMKALDYEIKRREGKKSKFYRNT